ASIFGIFLVRQYALTIPDDLLEAARIDGAGEWRIFVLVVIPVLRPIIITLGVFTLLGTWNDFMWPLIVLTDQHLYTLPVALARRAARSRACLTASRTSPRGRPRARTACGRRSHRPPADVPCASISTSVAPRATRSRIGHWRWTCPPITRSPSTCVPTHRRTT